MTYLPRYAAALLLLVVACFGAGDAAAQPQFTFTPAEQVVAPNTQVCIPITVQRFEGILKFSIQFNFDPKVVRFDSIRNSTLVDLDDFSYALPAPLDDNFVINWTAPRFSSKVGEDLPDGSVIMELCFTTKEVPGEFTDINITTLYRPNNNPNPFVQDEGSAGRDIGLISNRARIGIERLPAEVAIGSSNAASGQTTCIPVTAVGGFDEVRTVFMQFVYLPSYMTFAGVTNLNPRFGTFLATGITLAASDPGVIQIRDSLLVGPGITIPAGEKLFDLCFTVKAPCVDDVKKFPDQFNPFKLVFNAAPLSYVRKTAAQPLTYVVGSSGQVDTRRCNDDILIKGGLAYGAVGDVVTLPHAVAGFHGLTQFDVDLDFDAAAMRAVGASVAANAPQGFTAASVDLSQAASGKVRVRFNSPTPASFPDGELLFFIDFELIGPINSVHYVVPDLATDNIRRPPATKLELAVEGLPGLYNYGSVIILTSDPVRTYLSSAEDKVGSTVCIDVKVDGFQDIVKYRQGFSWDASVLRLTEVKNLTLPVNGNQNCFRKLVTKDTVLGGRGYFGIDWFAFAANAKVVPCASSYADGYTVATLCFEIVGDSSRCTAITPAEFPLPPTQENFFSFSTFIGTETVPIPVGIDLNAGFVCAKYENGFTLKLPDPAVNIGPDPTCFSVGVDNYNRIDEWRATLGFDASLFTFVELKPTRKLRGMTVDRSQEASGRLTFSVKHEGPTNLLTPSNAFDLCFVAKPGPSACAPIDSVLRPVKPYIFANKAERNLLVRRGRMCRVNPFAAIAVVPTVKDISCDGRTDGAITLVTSGGGGGFTYAWTGPGTVANARDQAGLAPGTYRVTVTDQSGWSAPVTRDITVASSGPAPVANAGPDAVAPCNSTAPVVLDAGASTIPTGSSLLWTPISGNAAIVGGGTTPTPSVSGEGEVRLTVTSPGGCSSSDVVAVARSSTNTLSISQRNDITCDQPTARLVATLTPATAEVDYVWSTVNGTLPAASLTTNVLEVGAPGTYTLTATDRVTGCTTMLDFVVADAKPTLSAAIATPDTLTCERPTVDLRGTATSSATNLSYAWTTADGSLVGSATAATVSVDRAGTYVLTVRDPASGCAVTQSVKVDSSYFVPQLTASRDTVVDCRNPRQTLSVTASGGRPFQYAWSGPGGGITSDITLSSVEVRAGGTYAVTVTDERNGCTATRSIAVREDLTPPVVEAGPDRQLSCDVTEVRISGTASSKSGKHAVVWTTAGGRIRGLGDSLSVVAEQAGKYFFAATDSVSGCRAVDSLLVTQSLTAPQASAGPNLQLTCTTSQVTLGGSGSSGAGFGVSWTTADGQLTPGTETSFQPTVSEPGTYVLTVTNTSTGCRASSTAVVTRDVERPRVSLPDTVRGSCDRTPVTLSVGGSASAEPGAYTFVWTGPAGETLPSGPTITSALEGVHTLVVRKRATGCDTTVSTVVAFAKRPTAAFAADTTTLICGRDSVLLRVAAASLASGQRISWTRDDVLTNDVRAAVGPPAGRYYVRAPGVYRLVLTAADASCVTTSAPVEIVDARRAVRADAGRDLQLSCRDSVVTAAAPPSGDPALRYAWESPDGHAIENAGSREARFRTAGRYVLTVTDTVTSCFGTDELIVGAADRSGLTLTMPADLTLSCDETTTLGPTAGVRVGPARFDWRSSAQPGVTIATDLKLDVAKPATYSLTVTDEATGCSITDSVVVGQAAPFTIVPNEPVQLACDETSVAVAPVIDNPSGLNLAYAWTAQGGGVVVGTSDGPSARLQAGRYEFRVREIGGSCEATSFVTVLGPGIPNVDAGPDLVLTCAKPSVTFEATGSDAANYTFAWDTPDGAIAAGTETRLAAVATRPGTYRLLITNVVTGCQRSDVATVTLDTVRPRFTVVDTVFGNCDGGPARVTIGGEASVDTLLYRFEWRGPGGEVIATSASASLRDAGSHVVLITSLRNGCSNSGGTTMAFAERPVASFTADTSTFICGRDSIALRVSPASATSQQIISWELANGDLGADLPVATADPATFLATSKGAYRLVLTAPDASCVTKSAPTVLFESRERLEVDAGVDLRQTCRDSVVVAREGSVASTAWRLQWSGPAGAPIGTPNSLQASFRRPGTYRLVATDPATKCTGQDDIIVRAPDQSTLRAALPEDFTLGCGASSILRVDFSVGAGPASFRWWESSAPTATLSTAASLSVDAAGRYKVEVTDEATGCAAVDSIDVDQVTNFVLGTVPTYEMTCVDTVVPISIAISNPSQLRLTYEWRASDGGQVVGPTNTTSARLRAGVYTFTARDEEGACEQSRTVTIAAYAGPIAQPIADADYDACTRVLTLTGNESDSTRGTWRLTQGTLPGFDPRRPRQSFSDPAVGEYAFTYQVKGSVCPAATAALVGVRIEPEPRVNIYDRVEEASAKTRDTTIQILPSARVDLVARVISADSADVTANQANRFGIRNWRAKTLTINYQVCDRNCATRCDTAEFILLRRPDTATTRIPDRGFPNTITPNADGLNDVFIIEPLYERPELYPRAHLTIVNRWGTILYDAQPYGNDFGGISDQGTVIPNGTYYYVFVLDPTDGEVYKGHLTIIR